MNATALQVAQAIRERRQSPVEILEGYLQAIRERNPELNAITWLRDEEELLAEARRAESLAGEDAPLFHGVPIAVKDLTETAGQPMRMGSRTTEGKMGRYDAAIVSRLRAAGFLLVGRSHAPEFGTIPVTETKAFGACRNPFDPSRTPGGSSGGAAAAVAAGMLPIAHASDGGGSTRIPAACTGLVGLKPSRARIPKGPWATEILHGFSTDGCVSRDIADTAAFLDIAHYQDPTGWYNAPPPSRPYREICRQAPGKLRVAIDRPGPFGAALSTEVEAAIVKTEEALRAAGHEIVASAAWDHTPRDVLWQSFMTVWSSVPAYLDITDWDGVEDHNRQLRLDGIAVRAHDYIRSVLQLQVFTRHATRPFGQDYDLLLQPVLAMLPPAIGWLFEEDGEGLFQRSAKMVPSTAWVNVTGQPAIALPVHRDAVSGLPVGIQLVGPTYREDMLLQVGYQLEKILQWCES